MKKKGGSADLHNCPSFSPDAWDEKSVVWKNKYFVKSTVISFFHIPLNFGWIMKKNEKNIKIAQAEEKSPIVFVDEVNLFKASLYISVKKPVVGLNDVKVSGNFLSKTFEGSFRNIRKWTKEMNVYVKGQKKTSKKSYYYYPLCPKCSRKLKKNYVVILAEV